MVNVDYFHCSSYDGLMEYTYFNVGWWYYSNKNKTSKLKIDQERVQMYEQGLKGQRGSCRKPSTYLARYCSLNKVSCKNQDYSEAICDCKFFWRCGSCQHILICKHLDPTNDFDLRQEVLPLQAARQRGRSKRAAPALVQQKEECKVRKGQGHKRKIYGHGQQ